MNYGTLGEVDGRWQLTFVRRLGHPREKVWRALTEPEHLRVWFPSDIEGERAAGAELRFVFRENEGPTLPGQMITYDPPSVLEFRWDDETMRFELEPDGDGTKLTFVNRFHDVGKAARDAAGWHSCLDLLDGREGPKGRWVEVHPTYIDLFPPEAATVGPPG